MRRSCLTVVCCALGLVFVCGLNVSLAAAPQGVLVVASRTPAPAGGPSQVEGFIQIIDPETNKEVAKIAEGAGNIAHKAVVSPDGKLMFAPIYGIGGVGNQGTDGTKIFVYDLATKKQIDTIEYPEGVRPHDAAFGPKDGLLYVSNEITYALSVIDPKTRKIIASIPTGQPESHDFVISPDGRRAYTINVFSGTISVLDLQNRKLLSIVPVVTDGSGAIGPGSAYRKMMVQRISISPDGRTLITADQRHQALAVVDAGTFKIKGSVPLPQRGLGHAITPDGQYALVTGMNQIAVVDLKAMKVVKTVEVPTTPQEILVRPDGKVAYVTANNAKKVAAIRIPEWTMTTLDIAENNTEGLAWWPGAK